MSQSWKIDKLPLKDSLEHGDFLIGVCDGIVTKIPRSQLRGPPGPTGPTGYAGQQGYIGQQGPKGNTGPAGDQGPQGPIGQQGLTGLPGGNGTDGSEVTIPELITSDSWAMTFFEDETVGAGAWTTGKGWASAGFVSAGSIADKSEWQSPTITDRRVVLPDTGGELVRALPWGRFWNRIMCVVALRVDGTANFNGEWAFGVCSGTAQPFSSATCTNFVGAHSGGTNTFTYTANANSWLTDIYTGTGAVAVATKVGNTITPATTGNSHIISAQEGRMSLLGFSVARPPFVGGTSVTYSGRVWTPVAPSQPYFAAGNWHTERSLVGLWSGMTGSWAQANGGNGAMSHSETAGVLDTLNFWWEGGKPLEIAAIVIRKVY